MVSIVAVRANPVLGFSRVTWTPGTAAPLGSVTTPRIVPVISALNGRLAQKKTSTPSATPQIDSFPLMASSPHSLFLIFLARPFREFLTRPLVPSQTLVSDKENGYLQGFRPFLTCYVRASSPACRWIFRIASAIWFISCLVPRSMVW